MLGISSYQKKQDCNILLSQSESFQKQLEAINSTEEQIKILRHNMRYDYIVVSDMLMTGDRKAANYTDLKGCEKLSHRPEALLP